MNLIGNVFCTVTAQLKLDTRTRASGRSVETRHIFKYTRERVARELAASARTSLW